MQYTFIIEGMSEATEYLSPVGKEVPRIRINTSVEITAHSFDDALLGAQEHIQGQICAPITYSIRLKSVGYTLGSS